MITSYNCYDSRIVMMMSSTISSDMTGIADSLLCHSVSKGICGHISNYIKSLNLVPVYSITENTRHWGRGVSCKDEVDIPLFVWILATASCTVHRALMLILARYFLQDAKSGFEAYIDLASTGSTNGLGRCDITLIGGISLTLSSIAIAG